MRRFPKLSLFVAILVSLALAIPLTSPSGAGVVQISDPIVEGLAGPLGLAVKADGTVYVSQSFGGKLTRVNPNGRARTVAEPRQPDLSISGVAIGPNRGVTYLEGGFRPPDDFVGFVRKLKADGTTRRVADIATHEETRNPDSANSYGFQDLTPECADEVDAAALEGIAGDPFNGVVDSNAYAVEVLPNGSKVVADAGSNAIFKVTRRGNVRTLAVLPPVPVELGPEVVAEVGLPECTVGSTYHFDPVPTDVELGPDGMIYVSSLGGGPEDGTVSTGGVFRLNPRTKVLTRIGAGFTGATDLAVTRGGDIFVTELFMNRISKLVAGGPAPVVFLNEPVAIEAARGKLWVAMNAFGDGAVVTVEL